MRQGRFTPPEAKEESVDAPRRRRPSTRLRWAALFLVLLSSLAWAPGDESALIRRCLTSDVDNDYHVEGALSQTVTAPGGEVTTTTSSVTGDFEIEDDGKVEDGKVPMRLMVKNLSLVTSPPVLGDVKGRKLILRAKVDELNNLTDISLEGVDNRDPTIASLISRLAQGPGTFPDKEVKPGDTWTVTEQASLLGTKKLEYKLRYEGEKTIDDETYWVLSADEVIPLEIDLGSMENPSGQPPAATSMVMKGNVHITANVLLDKNGTVYSMDFETKADVTVDSPQANGQVQFNSDEVLKIGRDD